MFHGRGAFRGEEGSSAVGVFGPILQRNWGAPGRKPAGRRRQSVDLR